MPELKIKEKKCKYCAMMISKDAKICPHCRKKQGWSLVAKIIIGFFILIALSAIGNLGRESTTNQTEIAPVISPKEAVSDKVRIVNFTWTKAGFDNIMEADFTIINDSEYRIKDIVIKCEHAAKSGTVIDSNRRTIYDIIEAKSIKEFSKFNMGFIHSQAESSGCAIVDFTVI
ncbi:MAG: zinc ribbon domain-containing protein [Pseudomonadota bacterium]